MEATTNLQTYVEQDEQGGDLRLLVSLIDEFGVETIIEALDRMPREDTADIVLSTAHKAKGREWDAVQIADDFPAEPQGEELRLLYVAVTRARLALDISAVQLLTSAVASAGEEDDSAAASIATDASVSVDGAESEDGTSPAVTPAAGPVPATDADVAVIQQRLGAIEDPIVRAAVAGALTRIEERLAS